MIRRLGIAERGRAAGQRLGSHGCPDGIDQIRAGFDDDDQVARSGDGESKLIRYHSEILRLRVPEHGRPTAKRCAPAGGSGHVVDDRIVCIVERIRSQAGGIPQAIDARQAAGRERIVPDGGDAVGDRDARQAGAPIERPEPDGSDAVGNRVASGFAARTLD